MKKLTGAEVRALRRQARCPDCHPTVNIDRATRQVHVHHSDGCPMWTRLQRNRATTSLMFPKGAGQTDQEFADAARQAAAKLADLTGAPVRLRTNPYGGLPPL